MHSAHPAVSIIFDPCTEDMIPCLEELIATQRQNNRSVGQGGCVQETTSTKEKGWSFRSIRQKTTSPSAIEEESAVCCNVRGCVSTRSVDPFITENQLSFTEKAIIYLALPKDNFRSPGISRSRLVASTFLSRHHQRSFKQGFG